MKKNNYLTAAKLKKTLYLEAFSLKKQNKQCNNAELLTSLWCSDVYIDYTSLQFSITF